MNTDGKSRAEVLMEQMIGHTEAIRELVKDVPEMKTDISTLKEDVSDIKQKLLILDDIKEAVADHSKDIRGLKANTGY